MFFNSIWLSACSLAVVGTLHYGSHAYVRTEYKLVEAKNQIVDLGASKLGYSKATSGGGKTVDLNDFKGLVKREAKKNGINPALLWALLRHESNEKPGAVSKAGAFGLMQIMPANSPRCKNRTGDPMKPWELFDPELNIMCGAKLFGEDLQATAKMDNSTIKGLYRYNGGPRCLNGGCEESIKHAKEVLKLLAFDPDWS